MEATAPRLQTARRRPAGDKVWIQLGHSSDVEDTFWLDADGYTVPSGDILAPPLVTR